jgi:hypothetical protein
MIGHENQRHKTIRVLPYDTGGFLGEVGPNPKETEEIEQEKERQKEHEEQLRREQQKKKDDSQETISRTLKK